MKRLHTPVMIAIAVALSCSPLSATASLLDQIGKATGAVLGPGASQSPSPNLSSGEIDTGLKEALQNAVHTAISSLGRTDGFLGNDLVRIPLPGPLDTVGKGLRAMGQGALVDEFVTSMNRAAEDAVPETASVFGRAIETMSIEDGRRILQGGNDAATRYFEEKTRSDLRAKLMPIVSRATGENRVTASYKSMTSGGLGGESSGLGGMLSSGFGEQDLDGYVTDKALDGLFLVMVQEEKAIRQNPAARTSEILRKVFGSR